MKQAEPILVRRAAAGDHSAFGALVEGRWTELVGLARSVAGEAEAEDAVQDALLVAWRKLGSLRDETAFPAWLGRIVVRTCLRRARRFRHLLPLQAVPEPRGERDPGAGLDVERLLGSLAPRQRAVMHLTVVEGMSDSEIGALLGITAAAVRSHRRRARQRLGRIFHGAADHEPRTRRAI